MAELLALAEERTTAYMCAERVVFPMSPHAGFRLAGGARHEVLHIDATGPVEPHKLMPEARMIDGQLIYRGDRLL